MKFKNLFKSNESIMMDALRQNDAAVISAMRGKEIMFGEIFVLHMPMQHISPQVSRVFVQEMTDKDWQKWGFQPNSRNTICLNLFSLALRHSRADLVPQFITAGLNLNTGRADKHPFQSLCAANILQEAKLQVLSAIISQGIDQIQWRNEFLKTAAAGGFITGFDTMKPLLDVDIHSDNEHLLRHAAENGQTEMCMHLVRKYGADIDVALITERTLGHQKSAEVLESARAILKPEAKPAPTIAGLAAQMQTMEQTIAELQANIRDITARLDMSVTEKGIHKKVAILRRSSSYLPKT
jgi:hypothetical protein